MKYKAIIFDLDGTAIPAAHDGMPSQELITVIGKYAKLIPLCAATGRSWDHAKPVTDALHLTRPCIVSGGTVIVDPVSEEVVWQVSMAFGSAEKVLSVARKLPYEVSYTRGIELVRRRPPHKIKLLEPINTLYILDIPSGKDDEVIKALEDIGGITISKATAWFTKNGIDLHITSSEATKEHAVAALCDILGVDSGSVAGIGDGHNDIHLFKAVGHKVAMGNAVQELKTEADQVIDTLTDNGLGKFITQCVEDT